MKNKIIGIFLLLMIFTAACGTKGATIDDNPKDDVQVETPDKDKESKPDENIEKEEAENEKADYEINDFFAANSDVEYIYEGDGGEFSSYREYIDFFNENKKQVRILNGGTEIVRVIEIGRASCRERV